MLFQILLLATFGLVVVLGLLAGVVHRKVQLVSEPMFALGIGVLLGPWGVGVADLGEGPIEPKMLLREVALLTVAVAVMASVLRLPSGYLRTHKRPLLVLLALGMLGMWGISALLAGTVLGLALLPALLLGAVVTPTDPVLAGTIVAGPTARSYISDRLRYLLTAEAGANDGAALPFFLLPLLLMLHGTDAAGWREWLMMGVLWETLGGIVLGFVVGLAAGAVEQWGRQQDVIEETAVLTVTVGLSLAVLGLASLVHMNGIVAVFGAGAGYRMMTSTHEDHQEEKVQEVANRLLTFPVFVLLGLTLPVGAWMEEGWWLLGFAVAVVLLRRPPVVWALRPWLSPLRHRRDLLLAGWFGPIGIAALYYALEGVHRGADPMLWHAASLVIATSVVLHGATSTPFSQWYHRDEGAGEG